MEIMPYRKQIRMADFDYSQNGAYFITICSNNRNNLFGEIIDGEMVLNNIGEIVKRNIIDIENHIFGVSIANYVVMPNHIHMILIVDSFNPNTTAQNDLTKNNKNDTNFVGSPYMVTAPKPFPQQNTKEIIANNDPLKYNTNSVGSPYMVTAPKTFPQRDKSKKYVPKAIQQFKASVSRDSKNKNLWQSKFHDHVIRNKQQYEKISQYIETNTQKWELDCFYNPNK